MEEPASQPVHAVLKIKRGNEFVNAEKNTDGDEEVHPGTVKYKNRLAEYNFPLINPSKTQYFLKQTDNPITWKRYINYPKNQDVFDNNNGADNIFKFEPFLGLVDYTPPNVLLGNGIPPGDGVGIRRMGGSKKLKKQSKRPSKGSKKQKKQSKSRKQRR